MIYPELKNLIDRLASAEVALALDQGITVLESYEVPEYMAAFERTIESSAQCGDAAVLDALLVDLAGILNYLLSMQGVTLRENVTMSERNAVAEALEALAYYEDRPAMVAILQSDVTVGEKLAELLTLITPFSADETLALLEEVDEGFALNFEQILQAQEQTVAINAEAVKEQIAAYVRFKRFHGEAPLFADRYVTSLGAIGMAYAQYLALYQGAHPALTAAEPKALASELVALACLSSDAYATPLLAIRPLLGTLFADITEATKVDIALTQLTLAWGAAKC